MTHVVMVDDTANSPTEGMEETVPVTIVETPPMRAVALRAYEDTPYGMKPITEVWTTSSFPNSIAFSTFPVTRPTPARPRTNSVPPRGGSRR